MEPAIVKDLFMIDQSIRFLSDMRPALPKGRTTVFDGLLADAIHCLENYRSLILEKPHDTGGAHG